MSDALGKALVVELLRLTYAAERTLMADLSATERAEAGTPQRWSAKEVIAHNTSAKEREARRLAATAQGVTLPYSRHEDTHDTLEVFLQYQRQTWEEVRAAAERVSAKLIAYMERLPDADLVAPDPERYAWLEGIPLAPHILTHGVWHAAGHLAEYYRARGQEERTAQLYTALVDTLSQQDAPRELGGDAYWRYNLACAYTAAGRHDEALELLANALQMEPGLVEHARHDPDLAPLRARSTFAAPAAPNDPTQE